MQMQVNQRACEPLADAGNRAATAAGGGLRERGELCRNTMKWAVILGGDIELMLQTDVVRVQLEEPNKNLKVDRNLEVLALYFGFK